ncbi:hypothetical protein PVAP13_8NG063205 [Panicum virgatum]|uniref:Uncharacterized protein n=1 Tax=Panicum virgatum TaxID=38727 RepID=A0A8T0P1X8_PANVG|nr:hypothetical protein PVAP13_8NG063205 [Panicum virgatum]
MTHSRSLATPHGHPQPPTTRSRAGQTGGRRPRPGTARSGHKDPGSGEEEAGSGPGGRRWATTSSLRSVYTDTACCGFEYTVIPVRRVLPCVEPGILCVPDT